jgi:hypothetical protein
MPRSKSTLPLPILGSYLIAVFRLFEWETSYWILASCRFESDGGRKTPRSCFVQWISFGSRGVELIGACARLRGRSVPPCASESLEEVPAVHIIRAVDEIQTHFADADR